jgi:hypothetical protein
MSYYFRISVVKYTTYTGILLQLMDPRMVVRNLVANTTRTGCWLGSLSDDRSNSNIGRPLL